MLSELRTQRGCPRCPCHHDPTHPLPGILLRDLTRWLSPSATPLAGTILHTPGRRGLPCCQPPRGHHQTPICLRLKQPRPIPLPGHWPQSAEYQVPQALLLWPFAVMPSFSSCLQTASCKGHGCPVPAAPGSGLSPHQPCAETSRSLSLSTSSRA